MQTLLYSAVLAGAAVVAITWLAGRLGGTIGGLLATAPVTSAAALIFLAFEAGNVAVGTQVLAGGKSLFAALLGMPVYFFTLKWTRGAALPVRLLAALAMYLIVFTFGTLIAHAITPGAWSPIWMLAALLLAGLLGATFLHIELPSMQARPPKMGMTLTEGIMRFAAGAGVVILVGVLRDAMPALSAAWAIFPGTFIVSLWVLGMERGAAFSAKASQGGVLGVPPIVAYLLVLWLTLPLQEGIAWTWLTQIPAWAAYFAVMAPIAKWRQGQASERPASA